jgi:DNA-binding IscR family transcriptional regulator
MQHVLRISRKIDYAIRAMIHLASIQPGTVVPFREIGIARSTRGPRGGYKLARPAESINVLQIIEAAEGPVAVNVCLDDDDACSRQTFCTMTSIWREGQERMLDVFRATTLASLAERPALADPPPVVIHTAGSPV